MDISNALVEFDHLVLKNVESGYAALVSEVTLKQFAEKYLPGLMESSDLDFTLINSSKDARSMLVQKEQELAKFLTDKSMYEILHKCDTDTQQYVYNTIHSMMLLNHIHECHRKGITLPNKSEPKLSNKFCKQSDDTVQTLVVPLQDTVSHFFFWYSEDLWSIPHYMYINVKQTLLTGKEHIVNFYEDKLPNSLIIFTLYDCLNARIKGESYANSMLPFYEINQLKHVFNVLQDSIDNGDCVLNIIEMLCSDEYLKAVMTLYNKGSILSKDLVTLKSMKSVYGSSQLLGIYDEWRRERLIK